MTNIPAQRLRFSGNRSLCGRSPVARGSEGQILWSGLLPGAPLKRLVLIVDDDRTLRRGLATLIEGYGHTVVTAATIQEGLEKLATSTPSHVILDMNLPDGHGTDILRHVRTSHLPVKVAVLSGSVDVRLLDVATDLRPDATFRKPPDWDALTDWIAA